ncbi:hypothetical protein [Nitrosomonas sp.]|uniref:hypothetical protein n=1 Tax=Nitrosomonas sp. TaxID=42353 RepID=UPI0035CCCEA5
MDASTIDLCLPVFPWADFRSTKGAIKLHVGLNHNGYLPEFAVITDGKTSDVENGCFTSITMAGFATIMMAG